MFPRQFLTNVVRCTAICCLVPSFAQAHFIFTVTEPAEQAKVVKVYFGEEAGPDDSEYLSKIADAKAWVLGGRRQDPKPLSLKVEGEALVAEIPSKLATQPVVLQHEYGVLSRGGAPFLLKYYAKTYPSILPGTWKPVDDAELLPFEINPQVKSGELSLTVTWQGKPLAKSQVTVEGPGLEEKIQGETDEQGQLQCSIQDAGLYSIRARYVDETAGELEGKKYDSTKHYTTLALRFVPGHITPVADQWPTLAQAVTSFGAGVVGDDLYVYGGHHGQAHHYSQEGQSGEFQRLNLKNGKQWEALPGGPKLTGLSMVVHDGKLYRVGGFTAVNTEDEDEKLISQSDFARFDPKTKAWENLAPLPEGRSSHDAVVIGDTLYVVGGWELLKEGGQAEHNWLKTAWSCDLSQEKPEWKPLPTPPFERRASSLAMHQGRVYVIGGMQKVGGPTTRADIFDPATNKWSVGPSILGSGMDGFGTASFNIDGQLVTTTMSGSIQKLSADGKSWEYQGQVTHPRFFHEMVPWEHSLVLVGGASMETGKIDGIEILSFDSNEKSERKAALK